MSKLPEELADLVTLQILDISHNSFITLPPVVFKMQKLRELKANDNQIIGIKKINFFNEILSFFPYRN